MELPNCKFFKQTLYKAKIFCECFITRVIGNGITTKFWAHNQGQGFLKDEFLELYNLVNDPEIMVREAFQIQDAITLFQPLDSPKCFQQFGKFCNILNTQQPLNFNPDDISWNLTKTKEFKVAVHIRQ